MECSAAATGVYVRLMCIMHKTDPYGTILLRQKDKQNADQILNFATKVAKSLPYPLPVIYDGISELLAENVLQIDGDKLLQKRMVKDGEISLKRSKSGKMGGEATKQKIENFAQANIQAKVSANTENENEYKDRIEGAGERKGDLSVVLPKMTKEDFVLFQARLIQDGIFIEPLMMNKGITERVTMLNWIKAFNVHIAGEEKLNKDYSEYKRHFKNWIVKQDTTKSPPVLNGAQYIPKESAEEMAKKYQRK